MKKLIMLCDYGLDDAVATAYILDRADAFEQIDILPVGGNFMRETSHNNAKRIMSHYKHLKNVRIVDTSCIPQPGEPIPDIHGADGMGNVLDDANDCVCPMLDYKDWVKTVDKSYTVLSLGPCTVTAVLLRDVGALPLIMMAGNISEKPNFKGYEFNHALDIEAFAECVKYPHVSATLDTCHHPLCDFYKINLDGESLFYRFARRVAELARSRGEDKCAIYDLNAAVYLMHPEKYIVTPLTDKDGNIVSVLHYNENAPLI